MSFYIGYILTSTLSEKACIPPRIPSNHEETYFFLLKASFSCSLTPAPFMSNRLVNYTIDQEKLDDNKEVESSERL